MITLQITEQTPHNMLRAIRAACNELLGETHADLTGAGIPVPSEERASALLAEQSTLASAFDEAVETVGVQTVAESLLDEPAAQTDAPETDSSGAEWNPELHASTKAKNQDGTWKKRRGAGQAPAAGTDSKPEVEEMLAEQYSQTPALPPGGQVPPSVPDAPPPLPPTPPATPLVTMNDIYALISGGKCVLNDVIAAAQDVGFADVGAFSREATPEQRAEMLRKLESA